ncbi:ABC transporter ATP-binding protein [Amygdalobacter nucleatus]|uniref:ABC transporter, ATP-binding protein n=1 Tax=Amygdalobacter nucleatus TaxID=3029274 RepID=A0A133Y6B1_9FIRM|nr:ABC transporter ATP-binding protein [Amygdalobacter nucleatus]KXB38750.1 ABC transporter, ATP-binding protein [Amygdalobacter nucleatus]MDF0485950.1 ABC transporter ATP-binding protein [Amygdalobacter nucleatus]WEG36287.1 ABC transporter ATP-binding protein [Amygdalobacter nucleatus]
MLEIKGLTKTYKRGEKVVTAVDHVDLTVKDGEFLHIIGHSGSGKSTLLSLIAGLLTADSGTINIANEAFSTLGDEERAIFRNHNIGIVPQMPTLLSALNVFDNIALPWYLSKQNEDAEGRVLYLLDELGISDLKDAFPHTLSGGEIRRVLIARALMMAPKLLLADEPTSDLDPAKTKEVMELFQRINQKCATTLIVVTHEYDTLSYGDRVLELASGKFKEKGIIS